LSFYFDTHTIVGYYLYEILRFYKEIYMRLRNIPGAGEVIDNSPYCIKEPVELKGKWHDFLGNKSYLARNSLEVRRLLACLSFGHGSEKFR
jgi:hypothetical protein